MASVGKVSDGKIKVVLFGPKLLKKYLSSKPKPYCKLLEYYTLYPPKCPKEEVAFISEERDGPSGPSFEFLHALSQRLHVAI